MTTSVQYLIQMAMALNLQHQQAMERALYHRGQHQYALEYATIRLDIGRMTGKTTAIANMVQPGDLVITYNHRAANNMIDMMRKAGVDLSHISVLTARAAEKRGIVQTKPKRIWIDEPKYVLRDFSEGDLYLFLADGSLDQQFIMLGR